MQTIEQIAEQHIARYPAADGPPPGASWWARERHAERQHEATRAALAAFRADAYQLQLALDREPPRTISEECGCNRVASGRDRCLWGDCDAAGIRQRQEHWNERQNRILGATSTGYPRGAALAQRIEAAARASVAFVDEPTPPEAAGGVVGMAKGCASVRAPAGAVARRGGGESSYLVFYSSQGAEIAAYRARSDGPSTWAEECSIGRVEAFWARHGRPPVLPVRKTPVERATQALFGGA